MILNFTLIFLSSERDLVVFWNISLNGFVERYLWAGNVGKWKEKAKTKSGCSFIRTGNRQWNWTESTVAFTRSLEASLKSHQAINLLPGHRQTPSRYIVDHCLNPGNQAPYYQGLRWRKAKQGQCSHLYPPRHLSPRRCQLGQTRLLFHEIACHAYAE